MPAYNDTPFKPYIKVVEAGWPEYLIGSYNFDLPYGKFAVTNFALTSDVVTLTGIIIEGQIPAVGDFISTQGQPIDVSDATIVSVTINANTGVGTITYAASHADVGSVGTGGLALIRTAEVAETVGADYVTIPVTMPFQDTENSKGRTITVLVKTPTNSSLVATYSLEGAFNDIDNEYTAIPGVFYTGNVNTSSTNSVLTAVIPAPTSANGSSSAEFPATLYRFFRVLIAYTSGTSTMIVKIMA